MQKIKNILHVYKSEQQLIQWFNNYFNNCYYVSHDDYPESVFMFYDLKYIRKLKLCKIKGEKISLDNIVGECLFEQDWKNKYLYCDYNKIWKHIMDNFSYDYINIQNFITNRLEMSVLTPAIISEFSLRMLEDRSKMNVLKPANGIWANTEERSKMRII